MAYRYRHNDAISGNAARLDFNIRMIRPCLN